MHVRHDTRLLTIPEVARELRVSEDTVRRADQRRFARRSPRRPESDPGAPASRRGTPLAGPGGGVNASASRLRLAYHEAGHALVATRLGRQVDSVSISPLGGVVAEEALAPGGSVEEIERGLTVVFAGRLAEQYAPDEAPDYDPTLTASEVEAFFLAERPAEPSSAQSLDTSAGSEDVRPETNGNGSSEGRAEHGEVTPRQARATDEAVIEHYAERVPGEVLERARELAADFVSRDHATGRLGRVADELAWRTHLTGDELAAIYEGGNG
jgi:hypothetical protein